MTPSRFVRRESCPACGVPDRHELLLSLPFDQEPLVTYLNDFYGEKAAPAIEAVVSGVDYQLRKCGGCGLIFQELVPDDELLDELYEQWLDPVESALHSEQKGLEPRLALQALEIVDHFDRRPGQVRILDFGMGWGEFCRIARGIGCEVAGAELSASRQEAAKDIGIDVIDIDQPGVARFDFVNTEQVFEHLTRPAEVLEKLRALLGPGGVLRISVPNCVDIEQRLRIGDWRAPKGSRRSLNAVAPLEHVNCYQHPSLVALAERCGLRPIYRPWKQLRFSPTWEAPRSALRFTLGRLYRSVRRQDTQVWFTPH